MSADEWHSAIDDLGEFERAPFEDAQTHADTFDLNGARYGHR